MLIMKISLRLSMVVCVAGLASCASFDPMAPAPSGTSYQFGFVSVAKFDLSNTELYMDRHGKRVNIAGAGFVGARTDGPVGPWAQSHYAAAPARIPDRVFLDWSDHRGDHEQAILLARIVPDMEHFEGTIWFVFDGEKWEASTLTKEQALWRETHDKGETPVD